MAETTGYGPPITSLRDERALFYFEHRALIETWAALRDDAARAITERLVDLVPAMQTRLSASDPAATACVATLDRADIIGLSRTGWQDNSGRSPVMVTLESEAKTINTRGALRLFVAVRVDQTHPDATRWNVDEFGGALQAALRKRLGTGWSTAFPKWISYRYVAEPRGRWTIEKILDQAMGDVFDLWTSAADVIDGVVTSAK